MQVESHQYIALHRTAKNGNVSVNVHKTVQKAEEVIKEFGNSLYGSLILSHGERGKDGFVQKGVKGKAFQEEEIEALIEFGNTLLVDVTSKNRTKELYYVLQFQRGKLVHWSFDKLVGAKKKYGTLSYSYGCSIVAIRNGKNIDKVKSYGTGTINIYTESMRLFGEKVLECGIGKQTILNVVDIYKQMSGLIGETISGDYDWKGKRLRIGKSNKVFYDGDEFTSQQMSKTVLYVKMDGVDYIMIFNVPDSMLKILSVEAKPKTIFRTEGQPVVGESMLLDISSFMNLKD